MVECSWKNLTEEKPNLRNWWEKISETLMEMMEETQKTNR